MATELTPTYRHYWNRGVVGDGSGYAAKFTVRVLWEPRDLWFGAFWKRETSDLFVYVCIVPCLPIRLHWQRAYGGRYGRSPR